ncbi:SDR family NAD(P)-dependent oxidoreductase [Thalassorhabdomicrobium marinisediminis]|uniref:SDR family NAD(P)-dependent oxidoreductase n=1 Tax=Thalassorhabdomicrobium marinisediminis TaxID=2170577 RepID=UPI0024924DA7|nr:SDR family oxidoreductase [Thalassorhabdomicrobium marinisediminis]
MTDRLKGKVAFITGGTGGIGEVACRLFATEGARVAIAGRREKQGSAIAEDIRAAGGQALFVRTDVTDEQSVKEALEHTVNEFGRLDILYNNAGGSSSSDGPVTETSAKVFWDTIKLDLFGTWLCCHYGIPHLIRSGGGSVINTASIMGAMGVPNRDAYSASKGGVISITRSMAVEYASNKVRVNVLVPGAVATERVLAFFASEPHLEAQKKAYLLGLCEPEDVANAALFLASDESRRTTGQQLCVDSGILIS